ncbi:GGDEF domain-containing protein [Iodidimonas gelatinilytica]|uniref:diguanylate cyclase n=1 Tax=Iodidimonas gelatinilytica TaxID=1236966 RepID=A0A5A7MUB2_9PROT|nr:GGDEF domain-containing protein [Iodidimonas gelatinilytica]GEQ98628.1 GGDEF domain-containing protein [Iodidimonas gelatinilytica]
MKVDAADAVNAISSGQRDKRDQENSPDGDMAEGGAAFQDDFILFGIPEHDLTPEVRAAISRLIGDVETLTLQLGRAQAQIAELEKLADHDALVPVLNRRAFMRELNRQIALANRYGHPVSILYFDVDNMKRINDRLTHAAGDAALLAVGDALTRYSRSFDLVARLGGDEFGLILPHTDQQHAEDMAKRLAEAVARKEPQINGTTIPLTVSYGAYGLTQGDDAEGALAHADRLMYAFKKQRHLKDGGAVRQ